MWGRLDNMECKFLNSPESGCWDLSVVLVLRIGNFLLKLIKQQLVVTFRESFLPLDFPELCRRRFFP